MNNNTNVARRQYSTISRGWTIIGLAGLAWLSAALLGLLVINLFTAALG